MSNIVRRLRPDDYWSIGEHESWFTDMAAEGLHLKKVGLRFVQFSKGEPQKMRYRVDVTSSRKITQEQKEMYAESGWDYVTSYGDFNVFSSPIERNAPELHTDPAEQSYTMKELDKRLIMNTFMLVVSVILSAGMVSAIWFLDRTPTLALAEGSAVTSTILTIIMMHSAWTSLQASISIRRLQKSLSDGKPINHNAPWKKHRKAKLIIAGIYTLVAISASIIPFIQLSRMETKTLPLINTDLPIVRLADIEQSPKLVRGNSSYIRDDIDWGNRYSYKWSLLAPMQYDTNEQGIIPNEMWKDGSREYSPSIDTKVLKLRFSSMAENLISDLTKRYNNIEYENAELIEVEDTDLDILIVQEEEGFKQVFASKGKAVMHVRYYGYAGMESIIDSVSQRINLIK